MNFVELEKEEYRNFANHHPLKSFFQTPEMELLGNRSGWTSYYVGVKKGDKIVAATRMMSYANRLGFLYFYAPRGPLLDYHDKDLLSFFTKHLKQYIKKKKGYMLCIDPMVVHLERNADGEVVLNGENNEDCVLNLKECGYIHQGYQLGYNDTSQCRWVYCLDLENKTEEQLLNEMKPATRNKIKKASRVGIHVREMKEQELPIFKKITEEASERNHFYDKSLEYYQSMYHLFHDRNELKYMIAELDTDEYVTGLRKEKQELIETLSNLEEKPKNRGKKKDIEIALASLEKKITRAEELCIKGKIIPLAASMFMLYGDEIIYYHSGNYKEYIEFNGQTMIQWAMIQYGLKHSFKRYNFYGINGRFDENDPEKGVYEFKKGFGGYVEEYIGDFLLPTSWYYYFRKFGKRK